MRSFGWVLAAAIWVGLGAAATAANEPEDAPKKPPPPAIPMPMDKVFEWDSDNLGENVRYAVGPYLLTFRSAQQVFDDPRDSYADVQVFDEATHIPLLKVTRNGADLVTLAGAGGRNGHAAGEAIVARLDPDSSRPSVILMSNTGGLHCCEDVQVASPTRNGWVTTHLGRFDNPQAPPHVIHVAGRTVMAIRIPDDRFQDFGGYTDTYQPVRFFGVRGGVAVDISIDPAFRPLIEADMARARAACLTRYGSGACPAYVADAVRVGRADEAWRVVRKAIRPDYRFPHFLCDGTLDIEACRQGRGRRLEGYLEAVRLRLTELGYLPGSGVAKAMGPGAWNAVHGG